MSINTSKTKTTKFKSNIIILGIDYSDSHTHRVSDSHGDSSP